MVARAGLTWLFCFFVTVCFAQGGFGGGGAGGGFQGGNANFTADAEEFTRNLFLTPGDKTEWTFEAKPNDSILVRITSTVFDPAVAIQDEAGNVLIENDDIEPGNQMAQVVVAITKPGTYKAVVTNYKGTAGGSFTFYARRFRSVELTLGTAKVVDVEGKTAWARINIPAPGDYTVSGRLQGQALPLAIMQPNGEGLSGGRQLNREFGYVRQRFFAPVAGVYFIGNFNSPEPLVKVAPVAIREAAVGSTHTATLQEDEVYDWRIQAKVNQLLEVSLVGDPEDINLEPITTTRSSDGNLYTVLSGASMSKKVVVAVHRDVRIAFSVWQSVGQKADYQIRIAEAGKPMPAAVTSKLDWFSGEYWTFTAKPGDVVKLRSSSPTFNVNLRVMDPDGDFVHSVRFGRTPEVGVVLEVTEPGQYVAVVTGGGIGEYRMTREVVEPKRLPLGVSQGEVQPGNPNAWRVAGRKEQDLLIKISGETLAWRLTVIGPTGQRIETIEGAQHSGEDLIRFTPSEDGEYTVVVDTAGGGGGKYTLRFIDLGQR